MRLKVLFCAVTLMASATNGNASGFTFQDYQMGMASPKTKAMVTAELRGELEGMDNIMDWDLFAHVPTPFCPPGGIINVTDANVASTGSLITE